MKIWIVTVDDFYSYQIIGAANNVSLARKIASDHKKKTNEYANIHETEMLMEATKKIKT